MAQYSTTKLQDYILGSISEICIVTPDIYQTATGLNQLGIGSFQIFDFTLHTMNEQRFRGSPGNFELKVAFAKHGALVYELMQPTNGQSLMSEYLESNGGQPSVQHVAFDMKELPMSERQESMRQRGFEIAMEGHWKGSKGMCHFCFFDTLEATGTVFETIDFSSDWEDPPCEWFPDRRPEADVCCELKSKELHHRISVLEGPDDGLWGLEGRNEVGLGGRRLPEPQKDGEFTGLGSKT